jgi:hypothetical protein
MQQRRVRLGDVLDDYCPRERRITNHAVVAMIEDEVKQTRCTTCDAEHEYKQAKVPATRRKKPESALVAGAEGAAFARPPVTDAAPPVIDHELTVPSELLEDSEDGVVVTEAVVETSDIDATDADADVDADGELSESEGGEDEWPVHRPLIRAQLPRPEGQTPERKAPDFTIRQNSRFDGQRNGNNNRHRGPRQAQGGQSRFGGSRSGSGQGPSSGQGQRHGGNRPGPSGGGGGQRGGRPAGQGGGRGPGRGPKRGR